jgi:predicted LPLAT superfamily acyltransferase
MLSDRSLEDEDQVRVTFLGSPAGFPVGPFRMAALLKCPSVLMFGIYRGGRRYDVHFELLLDGKIDGGGCGQDVETAMRLYVARLEHHCRATPFNWFNFYDFWK